MNRDWAICAERFKDSNDHLKFLADRGSHDTWVLEASMGLAKSRNL